MSFNPDFILIVTICGIFLIGLATLGIISNYKEFRNKEDEVNTKTNNLEK